MFNAPGRGTAHSSCPVQSFPLEGLAMSYPRKSIMHGFGIKLLAAILLVRLRQADQMDGISWGAVVPGF